MLLRSLLKVFEGLKVILLANLVQLLNELGLAVDAQFLALGKPKLLVDEVTQQVLVGVGDFLHRRPMLPGLCIQLFHRPVVVGAGDDLVVHTGDNLFDRGTAVGAFRRGRAGLRPGGCSKQGGADHDSRKNAKTIQSHRQGRRDKHKDP